MISKTSQHWAKTIVKGLNDLLVPILYVPAVFCSILSLFKSAADSNSRENCIVIAACCWAVIIVIKLLDRAYKRTDEQYHCYESKLARILDLSHVLPLLVLTLIVIFPFYLLFVTSLKNSIEANAFEFTWWPQQGIDLQSYLELLEYEGIIGISISTSVVNSFVYALIPTVIGLLTSAIAAYAFSKLEFRGRAGMYSFLIATMMMPGCVTMATSYMMFDWYGWTNSPLPLIIPGLFGGAGTVMFLREFFMGIPNGLLEAAEIDGAGTWRRFVSIMMPLARPALMAQFILGFISSFNNYMGPLIYLNYTEGYTIQVFLNYLNDSELDVSIIASAGMFSLVPMLLLYVIFQKPILNGISISSGLKG